MKCFLKLFVDHLKFKISTPIKAGRINLDFSIKALEHWGILQHVWNDHEPAIHQIYMYDLSTQWDLEINNAGRNLKLHLLTLIVLTRYAVTEWAKEPENHATSNLSKAEEVW